MGKARGWDGVGNWSSHPVKSPTQANLDSFTEVLCVFHWSEPARKAFVKGLRSWERAGRPGIPLSADDYRRTFLKAKRQSRLAALTEGEGTGKP